ncbi:hypothetical protein UM818_01330 [Staphylococcus aureus]|nr:hypothetical protein UM818_01330 [Staphylococcus aureus]WRN35931.1 hypothetical protein UM871_09750 [Staphylococcus aureus]
MSDKSKRTFNRWTSSEEDLLKKLYEKNITLNDIADFFPKRTNKQVRAKYDYMFKTKRNTLNLLNVGQKKRNKY